MNRCRLSAYLMILVVVAGGSLQGLQAPAGVGPGGTGAGAYRPGSGVTNPSVITRVDPVYTRGAVERRIEGEVWVQCTVNTSGVCTDIRVTKSLDSQYGLDQEAIKAVEGWRFQPGTKGGQPVAVVVTIAIEFSISSYTSNIITIRAIDATTRALTVSFENGEVDTFDVDAEFAGFSELKVGDRFRGVYNDSLVLEVHQPAEISKPAINAPVNGTGTAAKPPASGDRRRQTATVTVLKVSLAPPSLTVQTDDGRAITRKVSDRSALADVKIGDRIEVTYSRAVLASVQPAK